MKRLYSLLFLYSIGLAIALLTLSSFTDDPGNAKNKINGHEYVYLGLPSGTKSATCNVGAKNPWEYGGYYAWGETKEKNNYSNDTYKWYGGKYGKITKYCIDSGLGVVDNKTTLDIKDDVAHVEWGGSWRMPTFKEQKELFNKCIWTWTVQKGVLGYQVTGPNGNSIFLPAAGCRTGTKVSRRGSNGYYRSSSLSPSGFGRYTCSFCAYNLYFYSGDYGYNLDYRQYGLSVRPVSK